MRSLGEEGRLGSDGIVAPGKQTEPQERPGIAQLSHKMVTAAFSPQSSLKCMFQFCIYKEVRSRL